jgi:hypothetical protein
MAPGAHKTLRTAKRLEVNLSEAVVLLNELDVLFVSIADDAAYLAWNMGYAGARITEDLADVRRHSERAASTFGRFLESDNMFFEELTEHMRFLLSRSYQELSKLLPVLERYGKYAEPLMRYLSDPTASEEEAWRRLREDYEDIHPRPPWPPQFD